MLHTAIKPVAPASPQIEARSFTVTDNSGLGWHDRTRVGLPFELRCFGRGVCSIGGNRCHFQTRERAEQIGRVWVLTGVAPADQRERSL